MAGVSDEEDGLISQINVTPLVDITLVLLIVFMVTAKIIVSSALVLDLPQAAEGESVQTVFKIDVHADGQILVDGEKVPDDERVLGLAKEALSDNPELRAVIRADKTVQHGRIIRMLDLLKQAGIDKIAFSVTDIPAEPGAVKSPKPGDAPNPPEGE